MKVLMLIDQLGSNDGINTLKFKQGQLYDCPSDISEYLVKGWIKRKICKIHLETVIPEETKVILPEAKKISKRQRKK